MANFILIHGAMHGGWCWERVVPLLARHGHRVVTPDLPGMGAAHFGTDPVTLESWSDFTAALLRAQPGRSILVGHSLGGMVISQAAEAAAGDIAALVYLCALLPRTGMSAFDLTRGENTPDPHARLELHRTPDGACVTARPEDARLNLYGETPPGWAERAIARLVPQPVAPLTQPVILTHAQFGRVPRFYIECLRDRVIPLSLQRAMQAASPCRHVFAIDSDHSPFYSAPHATAAHLLDIAAQLD